MADEFDRPHFDLLIIGGGINGCGVARDAAGRGYKVCLCDMSDLGSGTSSASTKLIHGGLRYLEHNEFRMVREALKERETLWKIAPHIIWPMRFILPHHDMLRPKWMLRLGLFLYDNIGGRRYLPRSKFVDLHQHIFGDPLKHKFETGFIYSDCWVDDSRLVVMNAVDAKKLGAEILPRTQVEWAKQDNGQWIIGLKDLATNTKKAVTANVVINAAGPWVDLVLREVFGHNLTRNVRLVRGSHIVVKKKFDHDHAYIFQNADERIIFAIPYEHDYTLIGTTDADHDQQMSSPKISKFELEYLCLMASEYFQEPVNYSDIVWTYSGVRPLYDDGASKAQEATRDYVIKSDPVNGQNNLINLFGGKITTYRKLSEEVLQEVETLIGSKGKTWTAKKHLPGGDFAFRGKQDLIKRYHQTYPFLQVQTVRRLVDLYGTLTETILKNANKLEDLGACFGADLYESEVRYLVENEWVRNAQDLLYRRTKLGLRITGNQVKLLDGFIRNIANNNKKLRAS